MTFWVVADGEHPSLLGLDDVLPTMVTVGALSIPIFLALVVMTAVEVALGGDIRSLIIFGVASFFSSLCFILLFFSLLPIVTFRAELKDQGVLVDVYKRLYK